MTVKEEEEADECFPRGGQEPLSALERRTLQQKAKEDVLFGEVSAGDVLRSIYPFYIDNSYVCCLDALADKLLW